MAGRDDYGGSGRPGSNNSTGGGFSGDRSGGVGGGNASNYGGGGGNIRTASGFNDKNRGQPMGPGGTGFNPSAKIKGNPLAALFGGGGKGMPQGVADVRRMIGAMPQRVRRNPTTGVPEVFNPETGTYDPLSSIQPPNGADWMPAGPPIDDPRLGADPTNGITGVKPGAIPPNTGSGYNPQWHDPNGDIGRNRTTANKNRSWNGSQDNGVGQSGWGSYGGRK